MPTAATLPMTPARCALGEDDRRAWDDYVRRHPAGDHYQLSGWGRVIERSYRHRACYLWLRHDARVRAVLPLVRMRRLAARPSLVSLPFLDHAGLLADDEQTGAALYDAATALRDGERASVLELRQRVGWGGSLRHYGPPKLRLVLPLAKDPDLMWASLDSKVRNQVRKATKSGLTLVRGGMDLLDPFYDVFATNMRDLGSPVHARRFFACMLEEFWDTAQLLVVYHGRRPVAGAVGLMFRATVMVPWASALHAYRPSCPNHLLYWEAMKGGCEKGYMTFDFGRSAPGSGTYNFKKQWGAVEEPLCWSSSGHRATGGTAIDARNPRYAWLLDAWKRLPVGFTRVVGPVLRRQLSN
jgi:FemAB-related protein (PEP-CTERM system-associated)